MIEEAYTIFRKSLEFLSYRYVVGLHTYLCRNQFKPVTSLEKIEKNFKNIALHND